MPEVNLRYDLKKFVMNNGKLSDKLRLIAASYVKSKDAINSTLSEIEDLLNPDGGVPFDMVPGNPSCVKDTAEVLTLVSKFKDSHKELINKMVEFLVSRQKGDGGFAEALNLDLFIADKWGEDREWFPVGVSLTWLTGKALESLCLVGFDDIERLRRARDFLVYKQHEDGHWPNYEGQNISDPLATGNIIAALRAVGVDENDKVYKDGRAALFHHLQSAIESGSTCDMVDMLAIDLPKNKREIEVIRNGLKLIIETQNADGGWSQIGTKKSDPELSSILGLVLKKHWKVLN